MTDSGVASTADDAVLAIRAMGDTALLVDCRPGRVTGLLAAVDAAVRSGALTGVVDAVPAEATLLVVARAPVDLPGIAATLRSLRPWDSEAQPTRRLTVPVTYDGADLDEVAVTCRLSAAEVVRRHSARTYTVAFCGFAPGFAYLTGLDPVLQLPRRDTPRIRVPAGAVAMAAAYTAVYPRESPGGWHLLGRTALQLFDVDRDPPALLAPGDTVRFEPTGTVAR